MTSPPIVDLPVAKIRIDVAESNGPAFIAAKASSLEGLEAISRDWQANTRGSASGQPRRFRHVGGMSGWGVPGNIGNADTRYKSDSREGVANPYKSTTT